MKARPVGPFDRPGYLPSICSWGYGQSTEAASSTLVFLLQEFGMSNWKSAKTLAVTAAAIGVAIFSLPAAAQTPLKILGFDDMSCQAWMQSKDNPDQRALYLSWMRGLLTGHNYARPSQQVSTISSGTIDQYVSRYCREHPQGRIDEAVFRLSDQFSGRNSPITK